MFAIATAAAQSATTNRATRRAHLQGPRIAATAATLATAQDAAREQYYRVFNAQASVSNYDLNSPAVLVARDAYDATVKALVAFHGLDAECHLVDSMTWGYFSDRYKEEVGCRPNYGHFTLGYVKEWLAEPRTGNEGDNY